MIIIFWRRELCAAPGLCGGGGASLLSMAHYDRVGLALPRVVVCVVSTSGQVLSISSSSSLSSSSSSTLFYCPLIITPIITKMIF